MSSYDYDGESGIGGAIIGFFIIFFIVVLFIGGITLLSFLQAPYHGEHTGYVTAVEHGGLIWAKDSVYIKTNPQSSQEDKYCVLDKNLIPVLKQIQETGERATFTFDTPRWLGPTKCSDSIQSIITAVKLSTTTNQ